MQLNSSYSFENGSNCVYHWYHCISKELAVEFIKKFTCLRENSVKQRTFTVPIEKKEVTRIAEDGEEIAKNICYILQFIDSVRFMAS